MESRTALVLAVVSGALAVGLTAADTVWSLQAELFDQGRDPPEQLFSSRGDPLFSREKFPPSFGGLDCATGTLRLVLDNDKPLPGKAEVEATARTPEGMSATLLDETVSLGAFEVVTRDLIVPDEYRVSQVEEQFNSTRYSDFNLSINDDFFFSTCLEPPEDDA